MEDARGIHHSLSLATRVELGASVTSSSKERDTSQGSWHFEYAVLQTSWGSSELRRGSVEKPVSRLSRPVSSHASHVDTPIADDILENRMSNVGTSCWLFQKIKNVKSKV
jgi:hypothetical protein